MLSSLKAFRNFSFINLGYLFFVIAWGAFVRATGSGAGCGDHWPTCNGELIPRAPSLQTVIEYTHRVTSGLSGLLVLFQAGWAFRLFPKKHPMRRWVTTTLLFLVLEGAIGAGIVVFEWVAHDVSVARALSMAVHLVNTFLLLLTQTAVCFHARQETNSGTLFQMSWVTAGLLAILLAGVSGTVAALGDTLLFVSVPLGVVQEGNLLLQTLLQLRIWHPLIAVATSGVLLMAASHSFRLPRLRRVASVFALLVLTQLALGLLNVYLKAPVWLQLVHLLLADGIWVLLVWQGLASARSEPVAVGTLHATA